MSDNKQIGPLASEADPASLSVLADGTQPVPPHLKKLAVFLDASIRLPGGYRIGWDAILGLVPGLGDAAGLMLSLYIVLAGARLGVGGFTLLRMCANVAIEAAIGTIPLVGDVFDMGYKANLRNLKLIEQWCQRPRSARRQSVVVMIISAALIAALMAFVIWAMVFIAMAVFSLMTS
ncbi:MAG: DUF4112 domain-containing protein [Pseudomonadota bacterium]